MSFPNRSLRDLLRGRDGVRVIGDVQGWAEPFRAAVIGARAKNFAVLSLGDIVDRGPDSPGAMRQMIDLWQRGDGELVPGNHDDKFRRWAGGAKVEIEQGGLGLTIEQLAGDPEGDALKAAFAAAVAARPLWRTIGNFFFVHGAFDPAMLGHDRVPAAGERGRSKALAAKALYGETDGTVTAGGRPRRSYGWVDAIPNGMTVFVGHDVVSTSEILRRTGALGGTAVHLDTGIDRGGGLSHVDLPAAALIGREVA